MAVNKEWRCNPCERDFEGVLAICPKCGKIGKRAFRTAPGFNSGHAKRCDAALEDQFRKRGITNFTNATGTPKVTFHNEVSDGVHQYSESGAPVMAGWGSSATSQFQKATGFTPPTPSVPLTDVEVPAGAKVGKGEVGFNYSTSGACDAKGSVTKRFS